MILTPLQKLPKNVQDLGKLIVANGLKKLYNAKKSPNLVTLTAAMQWLKIYHLATEAQRSVAGRSIVWMSLNASFAYCKIRK